MGQRDAYGPYVIFGPWFRFSIVILYRNATEQEAGFRETQPCGVSKEVRQIFTPVTMADINPMMMTGNICMA